MQPAKTADAMSAPRIVVLRAHFITANSFPRLPPAKTNARTQALTLFAAPPLIEIDFPPCPPACQLRAPPARRPLNAGETPRFAPQRRAVSTGSSRRRARR